VHLGVVAAVAGKIGVLAHLHGKKRRRVVSKAVRQGKEAAADSVPHIANGRHGSGVVPGRLRMAESSSRPLGTLSLWMHIAAFQFLGAVAHCCSVIHGAILYSWRPRPSAKGPSHTPGGPRLKQESHKSLFHVPPSVGVFVLRLMKPLTTSARLYVFSREHRAHGTRNALWLAAIFDCIARYEPCCSSSMVALFLALTWP
jgi:hypothetical protein